MFEYVAYFDEVGAKATERAFFLRSTRELRLWITILPPTFLAIVVTTGCLMEGPIWFVVFFGALLILSLLNPVFFYVVRPLVFAAAAKKYPSRRIRLHREGISVNFDDRDVEALWQGFRYVWDFGEYLVLVASPYVGIHLPKRGMPDGALEFIKESIDRSGQRRVQDSAQRADQVEF